MIAGLGLILAFDPEQQVFRIRLESLEEWSPFVQETRAIYRVNRLKRDAAFREIVLGIYGFTCAVTGQRFVHGPHVEAEAAHIISKEVKGTDDPRNGLALSRTAHWAFDRGLFTITDQYEVLVHKKALDADHRLFPIVEAQGKMISQPRESLYWPHPEALAWHRKERFGAFLRQTDKEHS